MFLVWAVSLGGPICTRFGRFTIQYEGTFYNRDRTAKIAYFGLLRIFTIRVSVVSIAYQKRVPMPFQDRPRLGTERHKKLAQPV